MSTRHRFHPVRQRAQRFLQWFPLSATGVAILLISSLSLYSLGYQRMDLVVFALAVCALIITLAAVIFTTLTGQVLKRRQSVTDAWSDSPDHLKIEAGFPNQSGFSCRALPWLPLVSLSWEVVRPDAISTRIRVSTDGRRLEEELTPRRRCLVNQLTRRFIVSDVLGLARHSWTRTTHCRLLALPAAGHIRRLPLLRSLSAEDGIPDPSGDPVGDRMEIRPYTPGDPVRHILWNVYARNRQLNIRLEEKSVFHSHRTLAYLIGADEDEAAAATARVAIETGALGADWTFGADGSATLTDNRNEALELICASRPLSANSTGTQGSGLEDFLRSADSQLSHCILFAPAADGAWIQALRQAVTRHRGQFSVVLATDGFQTDSLRPWYQRLLFRDPRKAEGHDHGHLSSIAGLRQLVGQLGPLAGHILIVDRNTGQSFDRGLNRV